MRTTLLVPILIPACAFGQTTSPSDPISSARPSFSDSPTIVPVRRLQIESGLTFFSRGGGSAERTDFGEALLRYGLRPRLEIRLQLPNYNLAPDGAPEGFDNTQVAFSYYLGKLLGFDAGVIPTLEIPTGARGLRDEVVTPGFSFNLQRSTGGGNAIGGTLAQFYGRQDGRASIQSTATLDAIHSFGERCSGFVEYGGFFEDHGAPENYAHLGLQILTTKTSQFDIHGGIGLGGVAAHSFVGAGYSIRF